MSEASKNTIDPKLETRIIAMVMGEASDFERDELEQVMQQHPELLEFKNEFQELHRLLTDAGKGEAMPDDDWKLSAPKRDFVLA